MNTFSLERIFTRLSSSPNGLNSSQVLEKQRLFGKNILPEKKKNWGKILLAEFSSPLILILLAAVAISLLVPYVQKGFLSGNDFLNPLAIVVILTFNALLGFFQEIKAEKTLSALQNLQPDECIVLRDGEKTKIQSQELVSGDIIFLAEGEKIPADIRLLEAVECKVNESLLTGESTPVFKKSDGKSGNSPLESENMIFSGSQLISGRAKGVVVSIGISTEMGKIAHLLSKISSPPTPLEQKLDTLGKKIGIAVVAICIVVFGLSFFKGTPLIDALLTAVALAVGAVPEGLPAVMTISLAIGVSLMARKNMLIRDLKSVETLGSITVIASDKTGTITQNKMSVEEIFLSENSQFFDKKSFSQIPQDEKTQKFLEVLHNCNDAELPNIGDPTEISLLQFSTKKNTQKYERISEIPFSSETKWMSTTHEISGKKYDFIKGAPESIAQFCDKSELQNILDASEKLAKKGIRTIGVAIRKDGEEKAEFLGIAGLQDPPRESVRKAVFDAKNAGIRTLMITGDHAITAQAIGKKVGIKSAVIQGKELEKTSDKELQKLVKTYSIYARVSPEHKVRICKALQRNGEIVAMTGDGVNDAPALSQAEVGIAMGKVGTAVARSASDMVLLDDDFSTIVKGIKEGRRIYANIKKSVVFLLSTNFAEVLLLLATLFFGLPLPLLPIHILLINLFTDSFPALALAKEPAEESIMKKKPRPLSEGFLHGMMPHIVGVGGVITLITFILFWMMIENGSTSLMSQTMVFVFISLGELLVIFSLRSEKSIFQKSYFENMNIWLLSAVFGGIVILIGLIFSPLNIFLSLQNFPEIFWIYVFGGAILGLLFSESMKFFEKK